MRTIYNTTFTFHYSIEKRLCAKSNTNNTKVIRSANQIFWPAKMLTKLLFELFISAHLNREDT